MSANPRWSIAFLGEERVVVFDQAGTTRDSVYIPFERHGQEYTLIDTAGVRRRKKHYRSGRKVLYYQDVTNHSRLPCVYFGAGCARRHR